MNKFFTGIVVATGIVLAGASLASAQTYNLDPVHSTVGFAIQHMMVSKVTGTFGDAQGTVNFDPQALAEAKIHVTVKVASVDTKNTQRDGHLRSADFFDAEKFPEMMFMSKKIVKDGDNYLVTGELTIKGVTKEVTIPATILGPIKNPMSGMETLGLEAHFKINRQDYGIVWNKALDNGGLMLANDVDVNVNIEAPQAQSK